MKVSELAVRIAETHGRRLSHAVRRCLDCAAVIPTKAGRLRCAPCGDVERDRQLAAQRAARRIKRLAG